MQRSVPLLVILSWAVFAFADEPMVIVGTVHTLDGELAPGVIVYAYHTDDGGIYPRADTRHGRIRGWAKTDADGEYRFESIRPGSYPETSVPQHVHLHIIEPDRYTYYIGDIRFDDDPFLSEAMKARTAEGRGGSGLVHPDRDDHGVWQVRRDITLGENVSGYPR